MSAEKFRVVCYSHGRKMIVRSFLPRDIAEKVAEVLNEGARSNPRSDAVFVVEPLDL